MRFEVRGSRDVGPANFALELKQLLASYGFNERALNKTCVSCATTVQ